MESVYKLNADSVEGDVIESDHGEEDDEMKQKIYRVR